MGFSLPWNLSFTSLIKRAPSGIYRKFFTILRHFNSICYRKGTRTLQLLEKPKKAKKAKIQYYQYLPKPYLLLKFNSEYYICHQPSS